MSAAKDTMKVVSFEAFAKKAAAKLEERKKVRKKKLLVGDLGEEIEIRGLSEAEIQECSEYSEDAVVVDKYTIYYASRTLQDLAVYMKNAGMIQDYLEVVNMFSAADRRKIAQEIMELSGIYDKTTVSEVEEAKKS